MSPRLLDLVDGFSGEVNQSGAPFGTEACHVQHETAPLTSGRLHGQPRQFLQRFKNAAVRSNKPPGNTALVGVDDGNGGPITIDVDVDVTIQVCDVEQSLKKFGSNLTLTLELL